MSTSNDVLDAARTCLLRGGGRKLTLAEIAREAGVSRPTVYRRWPEVAAIIRDLLTREMARIIAEHRVQVDAAEHAAARSPARSSSVDVLDRDEARFGYAVPTATACAVRDAVVDTIVAVADAVGQNAVFVTLGRHQPELIAPYIFTRLGTSQRSVLTLLTARIEEAQRYGGIRAGRPDHFAAMVLLIAQSAVQSRAMIAPILGSAWTTELRRAVIGYLTSSPYVADDHYLTGDRS